MLKVLDVDLTPNPQALKFILNERPLLVVLFYILLLVSLVLECRGLWLMVSAVRMLG